MIIVIIAITLAVAGMFFIMTGCEMQESWCVVIGLVLASLSVLSFGCISNENYTPTGKEPVRYEELVVQTSAANVDFIENEGFINLNKKFGRDFEEGEVIYNKIILPVKYTSPLRYKRTWVGSSEIVLEKPEVENE